MAQYHPRPSAFGVGRTIHEAGSTIPQTSNTTSIRSSLNQPPAASSALQARINQKRAELENLRQLRDLSGNLTQQLEVLEQKLGTLKDGAQSVALVLANWENVLGVIRMAGMRVPMPKDDGIGKQEGEAGEQAQKQELPVPLVRIPIQVQQEEPENGG